MKVALTGAFLIAMVLISAVSFAAEDFSINPDVDRAGVSASDGLKKLARGPLGKALFFGALLIGIILILSNKHRTFGLVALLFGFLLGAYGGIAEGLWKWFTSFSE